MAKRFEGNGLWESSRMMLPEHRATLAGRREFGTAVKTKSNKRPVRDEFELEELGNQLVEAYQEGYEIAITLWNQEEQLSGQITKLDPQTKRVHISRYSEVMKIPFLDILKIEKQN